MKELLTKMQQKELYSKIGRFVASELRFLRKTEFTYKEIADRTGLSQVRISEIVNEDVNKPFNEKALVALLGGNILKVSTLLKKCNLTEAEATYLKNFVIYEDQELAEVAAELKLRGINPAKILKDYLARMENVQKC